MTSTTASLPAGERQRVRRPGPARGVLAVAEDEHQHRPLAARAPDQRRRHGVDERRPPGRRQGTQPRRERVRRGVPRSERQRVVERQQRRPIGRGELADERQRGGSQGIEPRAADAVAHVERERDVDRLTLERTHADGLRPAVVGDDQVGRRQPGDRAAVVEDERLDPDGIRLGAELRREGGEREAEREQPDHGSGSNVRWRSASAPDRRQPCPPT